MRRVDAILAAAMAISLGGCVLRNKPQAAAPAPVQPAPPPIAKPAPPSPPLSANQTQVDLPPPQPLSLAAIATTEPPEETPTTVAPRNPNKKGGKPASTSTSASQHTEPVGPVPPPVVPPPPAESERPQIGEIVPAAEQRRLQAEATKIKQDIHQKLQQVGRRRLSAKDQDLKDQANSLVAQSDAAQHQGDMRKAYDLALRGLVYAKALVDSR
jgi:hypothetical protein